MNDERVCNCLIDEDVIDMRDCPIHDGDITDLLMVTNGEAFIV